METMLQLTNDYLFMLQYYQVLLGQCTCTPCMSKAILICMWNIDGVLTKWWIQLAELIIVVVALHIHELDLWVQEVASKTTFGTQLCITNQSFVVLNQNKGIAISTKPLTRKRNVEINHPSIQHKALYMEHHLDEEILHSSNRQWRLFLEEPRVFLL